MNNYKYAKIWRNNRDVSDLASQSGHSAELHVDVRSRSFVITEFHTSPTVTDAKPVKANNSRQIL